ncbi:MAG: hypothetical protein BGO98_40115 [Myxococcales bacterium 68-20]|nr:MAG: hypothetical protein BGO98_40115 [Myxococcales bacterium 68-20]
MARRVLDQRGHVEATAPAVRCFVAKELPMRPDRMTTKSHEPFHGAADLASRKANPEITPEHLVLAMLEQEGGVAPPIFQSSRRPEAIRTRSSRSSKGSSRGSRA